MSADKGEKMNADSVRRILRKFMKEKGCTQQYVADKSGLSRSYISTFLNGYNSTTGVPIYDIKTDTAEGLARAMDMTFEELVVKASGQKESKTLPIISNIEYFDDIPSVLTSSEEYIVVSKDRIPNNSDFGFIVGCDLPNLHLLKNDIVIIATGKQFNSGDIILALREDEPANCVRVFIQSDGSWIVLNEGKEPKHYAEEQKEELRIVGKIVAMNRFYN